MPAVYLPPRTWVCPLPARVRYGFPMTETLHVMIGPAMRTAQVARALAGFDWAPPEVIALLVPEPHAGGIVVVVVDGAGTPIPGREHEIAQKLASSNYPICVATTGQEPRWTRYEGGDAVEVFDHDDDLFLPVDEDGFPEFQHAPIARRDGPPDDWRVFRSCLDRGMDALLSCRFRPVERALARALGGASPATRAYFLRKGGRALKPPAEVPWPAYRARGS